MADLLRRLNALRPTVERIRTVSGATGVSVGVIHGSRVILTDNFGFRDVENQIRPDQDTIYYLASLSKSFTAVGVAHLIEQSEDITWDTPVSKAFPNLAHEDQEIRENATILDFLSHRAGLAPKNHIWQQEYGHFTLRPGDDLETVKYLEKIADFRRQWIYNNWGYVMADEMIEQFSGVSWGAFLKGRIFDCLGLNRTVTKKQKDDDNVAKPYIALSDGTPWLVPEPDGEDGKILEGALAVRSCIRDLTKYYIAFMKAVNADRSCASWSRYNVAFVDASKLVEPYIRLETESDDFRGSYGLGWVRVRLPCTLGAIGLNHDFVGKMPIVGKGIEDTTCFYHQGSANSFLSSVHLLPETESGVVVLTNSMAQNDVADWLGELYLETILNNPERNNYVQIAHNSADAALALWPAMREELAKGQEPDTPMRPAQEYVGRYYNKIGNFHIEILKEDERLVMRFQWERKIGYDLTHYHWDTFSWLITHDQDAKLGRFPVTRASFYLIQFRSYRHPHKRIDSLIWIHDDKVPEGEPFFKQSDDNRAELVPSSEAEPAPDSQAASPSLDKLTSQPDIAAARLKKDTQTARKVAVAGTVLGDKDHGIQGTSTDRKRGRL